MTEENADSYIDNFQIKISKIKVFMFKTNFGFPSDIVICIWSLKQMESQKFL